MLFLYSLLQLLPAFAATPLPPAEPLVIHGSIKSGQILSEFFAVLRK